ncbi:AarF/ABC1/UbiB kinase family protein, partial [Acidimicrobiaceae bacterium USS-CC1]|nr:AarF/ABC1/UbiB kinase family protein [Acidiferrimicrobium australe]
MSSAPQPSSTGGDAEPVPSGGEAADLAYGAFSSDGPWVIDPDHLEWRVGLDRLRAGVAAQVPLLLRRRRVPPVARVARTGAELGQALALWWL